MDGSPGGWAEGNGLVGRTIGHYRVESGLGRGGMGEVYLAQDLRFPRKVALKRMAPALREDPEFHRRFLEEAERAIRIADRRIAQVHDVLDHEGDTFLVMEYVPGPSLRERLHGRLDVRPFLALAIECTEALATAHRQGIVHRDIKPENYVLTPGGLVKLLDLGIAKELHTRDSDSTMPLAAPTTRFAGTPCYMAPEALLTGHADARSDIFSLGVMFYEMLAGENPFRCDAPAATTDRILHQDPAPLSTRNPQVPRDLQAVIERMLAKDPLSRQATALDVLVELVEIERRLANDRNLETLPIPLPTPPPGPPPPRPWRLLVAGAALLAVIGYAIWNGTRPPPLPEPARIALFTFVAPNAAVDTRIAAAGLTRVLHRTLTRMTNPHALEARPRPGRVFAALGSVSRDQPHFGENLVLSGRVTQAKGVTHVSVDLRSARDSSRLRETHLEVPAGDGLALTEATLRAVTTMLAFDLTDPELRVLWNPGTTNSRAGSLDLRGEGYLHAASTLAASNSPIPRHVLALFAPGTDGANSNSAGLRTAFLDSAAAAFARACQHDSSDTDAWIGLARVGWEKRTKVPARRPFEEIAGACQRALTVDLDNARAHALLGRLYAEVPGRELAAIPELERALELDPTDAEAILSLLKAYERTGNLRAIDSLYQAAIALRPHNHYWFAHYGYYCWHQARYEESARWYQRAIALAPEDPSSYAALGAVCMLQGRYESAIPNFAAAIERNPTPRAYSNLGTTLFLMRRFAAAESVYTIAVQLSNDDYILWGNLADAYFWDPGGRAKAPLAYQQAKTLALQALAKSPEDPLLLARLAHYEAKLGEIEPARDHLRRALAGGQPNHDLLYKAAVVYEQLGEADSALAYLDRALQAGYSRLWVQDGPEVDHLRDDVRFTAMLSKPSVNR